MKGLKKLALASAVAAAPFATQAMEPMSEKDMGNVTGQSGVTIELQTQVGIGQMSYTQDTAGSFLVDGIAVGGHSRDGDGDIDSTFDATMEIDLQDNGDALISFGGFNNAGSGDPSDDLPVLLGLDFDSAGLEGEDGAQATLMSDFTMDMFLSQLDIKASTEDLTDSDGARDNANGHIAIDAAFGLDLDADFDVAAIGVRGVSVGGAGSLAALQAGGGGAALQQGSPAVANMTIHAGEALSTYSGVTGDQPDEALIVNVDNFSADVWIEDVVIGNSSGGEFSAADNSIGSVGLSNLEVTNTRMAVYGRE